MQAILESSVENQVKVYPNPSENTFTIIMSNLDNAGYFEMSIGDLSGRSMYAIEYNLPEGLSKYEFVWDAKQVNKGIYFYMIRMNNGKTLSGKMIKV